jgi:hypothetical protein
MASRKNVFSRASCRRCGLSAVLIPVFLHSLGHERRPFKWRLFDNFRYAPVATEVAARRNMSRRATSGHSITSSAAR